MGKRGAVSKGTLENLILFIKGKRKVGIFRCEVEISEIYFNIFVLSHNPKFAKKYKKCL